jgi:hypothetical protein
MIHDLVSEKNKDYTIDYIGAGETYELLNATVVEKIMQIPTLNDQVAESMKMLYLKKEIGLLEESELDELNFLIENKCLTINFIEIICALETLPDVHEPMATIEDDYEYMMSLE